MSPPKATDPTTKPKPTEPTTQPSTTPPTEMVTEPSTEPPAPYDPAVYVPDGLDRQVAELVNGHRQMAGLESLAFDEDLCMLAAIRALEITNIWSHTRPNGEDWVTVLGEHGYEFACEKLYYGLSDGNGVVERWMLAEGTQPGLLGENAKAIGVAHINTADGLTYVAAIIVG